jgi:hypothetical protein
LSQAITGRKFAKSKAMTGMPWIAGEGRKAVLTEYFWLGS